MSQKKKLNFEDLQVTSFVTKLNHGQAANYAAGYDGDVDPVDVDGEGCTGGPTVCGGQGCRSHPTLPGINCETWFGC